MSLIEDAKAAHKADLSYGEYMTTKKPDPNNVPIVKYRYCLCCGDRLSGGRIKFCSLECRQKKKREEAKEAQK